MLTLSTYFADFLKEIRLTDADNKACKLRHHELRNLLKDDPRLSPVIVSSFLQGSYRRATAIKPHEGKKSDVDVIIVTRLSATNYDPSEALDEFMPFLEKHYKGKYEPQGRSFGIKLDDVELDLVITAAPSESEEDILTGAGVTSEETVEETDADEFRKFFLMPSRNSDGIYFNQKSAGNNTALPEWKRVPLLIPDRDVQEWKETDPLAQIRWTWAKNERTNGHYINVVKALKWWRRIKITTPKYPKGYPVEHLVGHCCPDNIGSVAEGVTLTLEILVRQFKWTAQARQAPDLPDHGVAAHNVLGRVDGADFALFYAYICEAAVIARQALEASTPQEASRLWRQLFGEDFPASDDTPGSPGYTPRSFPSNPTLQRFG